MGIPFYLLSDETNAANPTIDEYRENIIEIENDVTIRLIDAVLAGEGSEIIRDDYLLGTYSTMPRLLRVRPEF